MVDFGSRRTSSARSRPRVEPVRPTPFDRGRGVLREPSPWEQGAAGGAEARAPEAAWRSAPPDSWAARAQGQALGAMVIAVGRMPAKPPSRGGRRAAMGSSCCLVLVRPAAWRGVRQRAHGSAPPSFAPRAQRARSLVASAVPLHLERNARGYWSPPPSLHLERNARPTQGRHESAPPPGCQPSAAGRRTACPRGTLLRARRSLP